MQAVKDAADEFLQAKRIAVTGVSRTRQGHGVDASAIASGSSLELVEAVPATEGGPYWEGAPAFRRYTLAGYPVSVHSRQPQIFVYTVADLPAANPAMAQYAADLQTMLDNHQAGQTIPFLPISPDTQLIRSRMEFVDFKGGRGVQFLTQIGQGLTVMNNNEMIFTFQGLTYDGKYYISAIMPINQAALPANNEISDELKAKLLEDFPGYLNATVSLLETEPADSFTPNLVSLTAFIRSIDVR